MKTMAGKDLTRGSIVRNLVFLGLPIMLSNLIETFYIIADAFWLGKLGENATGAVATTGISWPLIFSLTAFGSGFVVAGTALVSRFKGSGEPGKIKRAIGQFILILIVFTVLYLSLGLLLIEQILRLMNTPAEIFTMAKGYMQITLISVMFMFVYAFYQSISHGLGDTISPMVIQIIAVVLNVVIDPFFIFGIGFFPRLETIGAATATLIARSIGAVIAVFFIYFKMRDVLPSWKDLRPDWGMLRNFIRISIPASIGNSATSFGFLFLQGFVNSFGIAVITINTIGINMINLYMMPSFGLSAALTSVVGQNLGAKNIIRAEKSFRVSMIMIMAIMGAGCIVMYFFGTQFTRLFIDEPEVVEIGRRMFKITAFAAFFFGPIFVFWGVFNGSGQTSAVMIINIVRLWLFRIPLVFILSGKLLDYPVFADSFLGGILELIARPLAEHPYDALWWSMIISNFLSFLWAYNIYRTGKWKKMEFH